jgi:hypothetical protein
MDRTFYVDVLYPLQDEVLRILGDVDTELYLTGGTAASRGYLHHRFSDDLDFFVNDDDRFKLWGERFLQALARDTRWRVEVGQREERYFRLNLIEGTTQLKIELVNDVPAHVGPLLQHPRLGRLDSAENILANKITALVDRREPKDLADIWGFCHRHGLSLEKALTDADSKAAGIFPADVARRLCTVTPEDWELVRWDQGPDPEQFVSGLVELGQRLLLIG